MRVVIAAQRYLEELKRDNSRFVAEEMVKLCLDKASLSAYQKR